MIIVAALAASHSSIDGRLSGAEALAVLVVPALAQQEVEHGGQHYTAATVQTLKATWPSSSPPSW